MTPRCDGCRYWIEKPEARALPATMDPATFFGWTPWVGGRDDPSARVTGLCRRYPTLRDKAPGDFCGEYVGKEGA